MQIFIYAVVIFFSPVKGHVGISLAAMVRRLFFSLHWSLVDRGRVLGIFEIFLWAFWCTLLSDRLRFASFWWTVVKTFLELADLIWIRTLVFEKRSQFVGEDSLKTFIWALSSVSSVADVIFNLRKLNLPESFNIFFFFIIFSILNLSFQSNRTPLKLKLSTFATYLPFHQKKNLLI